MGLSAGTGGGAMLEGISQVKRAGSPDKSSKGACGSPAQARSATSRADGGKKRRGTLGGDGNGAVSKFGGGAPRSSAALFPGKVEGREEGDEARRERRTTRVRRSTVVAVVRYLWKYAQPCLTSPFPGHSVSSLRPPRRVRTPQLHTKCRAMTRRRGSEI